MKLLDHIAEPLVQSHIDPQLFRQVAAKLVGKGGEFTACGRALERLIDHAFPKEQTEEEAAASAAGRALAERRWGKLGFEEAYGSTTFPPGKK